MDPRIKKNLNQIVFEETLTRIKNAQTDAERSAGLQDLLVARKRLNRSFKMRHWLATDPTIQKLMREVEEAISQRQGLPCPDARVKTGCTDTEKSVEMEQGIAARRRLARSAKMRHRMSTDCTIIAEAVSRVETTEEPEFVACASVARAEIPKPPSKLVSGGTDVVACRVKGVPLPKLYIGPVEIEGPIDQIQLKQGFPDHVEYVLMCDLGPVGRTTSRNFVVNRMPGAETMLRAVNHDLSRLPNLWIDSPDSDVCRPKDGRFFNSTYEVCFENKDGTRYTQCIYPNDMALFDMGGRETCGIDIDDPPYTFSLLQCDTDPWMKLVNPKLVGIDKEVVTGLMPVNPDTPLCLKFLIASFHGTQGMLPKKLTCTQYFKVDVIELKPCQQ
jgi:hypothetical protein